MSVDDWVTIGTFVVGALIAGASGAMRWAMRTNDRLVRMETLTLEIGRVVLPASVFERLKEEQPK